MVVPVGYTDWARPSATAHARITAADAYPRLVLLITPHLVRSPERAADSIFEEWRRGTAHAETGGQTGRLWLHRHGGQAGQEVQHTPERSHLVGGSERHANGFRKSIRRPGDEDAVRPEVLDHRGARPLGVEHHKVRLRIERPQHARIRLVEEFLTVVRVLLHRPPDVLDIRERADGRDGGDRADAVGQADRP